LLTAVTALVEV
jgi:hypothetical protein